MSEPEPGCFFVFLFLILKKKKSLLGPVNYFYTSMAGRNFDAVHNLVGK